MVHNNQAEAGAGGKRSSQRIKARFPVVVKLADGRLAQATTVDISREGLLLAIDGPNADSLGLDDRTLGVGAIHRLMLFSPLLVPARILQPRDYRIVRQARDADGNRLVGLMRMADSDPARGVDAIDPADYQTTPDLDSEFLKIVEQINLELAESRSRVIMLCGAESGAGVTSLAWWLAGSLSRLQSRRVMFADANLRPGATRPGEDRSEGLLEVLLGQCTHSEAAVHLGEGIPSILNAGGEAGFSGREITDERVRTAVDALRTGYDYTVIDALPPADSPLTLMMARHCDGVFLVLASGQTDQKLARETVDQLRTTGTRLLGILLNRA